MAWYQLFFQFEVIAEAWLQQDNWTLFREMLRGNGDVDRYISDLSRPDALKASLNWYRAMRPADFATIPAVRVPTTYVWGVEDLAVGRVAAESCAGYVTGPYRFVAMDGVGHWLPEQCPDVLAALILEQVAL